MLNKKEKYIMEYLYQNCTGKKSCLIPQRDIMSFIADKYMVFTEDLDKVMTDLSYDNYIDLVRTDKQGEPVYCVSLKIKGEAFHRELTNDRRSLKKSLINKLLLAVLGAVITGFISLLFVFIKSKM